ncbi:MAG: glycosyltransferase [Chthoniobacterales bacterium]
MSDEAQPPHPRVLLFSHETTLSGAPMQLLHLARELIAAGWSVTFAAPEPGAISELLVAENTPVIFDPTFLTDLSHVALRELCPRFDVVVANTITSWPVVHAAYIERVPVIWYIHETRVGVHLIGEIPQIRPSLREADLIVTPTRETARIYEALTSAPIEVVPYGIPDLGFSAASPSDVVRFLLLGSYEPRKGQDVMMAAIERLDSSTLQRCQFTFAGRPLVREIFERLKNTAAKFPNVEIHDGVDHQTARHLMAAHEVLVCSSRDETMPIAIIEAMSLGRAVISTDVGGIREWLKEELNGWLVPAEDSDALAGAITRAVADDRPRREFASAGRRTYEQHFRLASFTKRFAEVLRRTAATRPAPVSDRDAVYQQWVREFDTFSEAKRTALRRRLRALRRQPLISVLMPVFDPDVRFLRAAIESVKAQVYERWELCIADDASTDPRVRALLEKAAASDDRVKLFFRETNGHISAASNSALALATGEWCALLDHDDELAPAALSFVALEIAEHPNCALIYSDEDKIDETSVRSNPFFKTDWNPQLFLGQNYINHLGVYRADLLREIGGFREGFEGSQDYDLALRCIERLTPEQIRHIPRVLYHWRTAAGSLAGLVDAKPYAREAARRAIHEHLERSAIRARVEPCPENGESHRVVYALPEQLPLVTAVILTRDRAALLEQCVRSLRERTEYAALEILIVDNGSAEAATHELFAKLKEQGGVRVLHDDGEFNFSRLNNLAAQQAAGELLLFLNNDIEATEPGWLAEMVSHALRPNIGAVGARLWFPNETLQHGGVVLGLGGAAGHAHVRIPRGHPGYFNRAVLQGDYSAVTAACVLVPRHAFYAVGGFNERDLAVNFNDVDFCLRLRRKGLEIVWTPYANLIHHESASRGHHRSEGEQAQFAREITYTQWQWGAQLMDDPLYSPNLTLSLPGFEIAFPPRVPRIL